MSRPVRLIVSVLAAGLLAVLPLGSTATAATPAVRAGAPLVTVTAPSTTRGGIQVRWRTHAKLAAATLTLNRRRVAGVRTLVLKGDRATLALDAADGVRFGRNVLVTRVVGITGRRQTLRRTVVVRRDAPLPAVQTHGARVAGRTVRLDGRRSRAVSQPLSYSWRIVRAPRNAKAKLVGARTATPRLVGSLPGRYAVALTVRERAVSRRPSAFAGRANATAGATSTCTVTGTTPPSGVAAGPRAPVASTPATQLSPRAITVVAPTRAAPSPVPAPRATAGCATQVEEIAVGANALPIGVAIDTHAIVDGVPSMVVGGQSYPLPAAGDGPAAAIFDAETLELLAFITPLSLEIGPIYGPAIDAAEVQANAYVQSGQPVLMVAAGVAGCCNGDNADSAAGFSAIETWGAEGADLHPMVNEGQILGGAEDVAGEQVGWLQPGVPLDGASPLYAFVSPDRTTYDTQVGPPSTTGNTMQVGTDQYTGTLPAGTTAGYQVLVLDAALTPQLGTPTVFGTTGDPGIAGELAMSQVLQTASSLQGSTTLIQSINSPQPMSSYTMSTSSSIANLGGTQWMFLTTNGSNGDYALVGNPGSSYDTDPLVPWAAEAQSGWTAAASDNQGAGNGTLSGVLRRRADSAWTSSVQSALGDSGVSPDFGLSAVAVQPAVAWPFNGTAGQVAATLWFATQLGLTPGPGSCWQPPAPDFRSSYCNAAINWNSIQTELGKLDYPASSDPPFTQTDFVDVQNQLSTETGYVASVATMIATLQLPFTSSSSDVAVDAQSIAGDVISAIPPPSESETSANLAIAGSIFDAAALVPEAGDVLGAVGAALDIASALTQSDGATVPYWQVQTAADQMGKQMSTTLATMAGSLGALEEVLVSDWGRMSAAVTGAQGPWGISEEGIEQQQSVMELGVEQAMWNGILPSAFSLDSFPGVGDASLVECDTSYVGHLWFPWGKASSLGSFLPLNTWSQSLSSGAPASSGVLAMLAGGVGSRSSVSVSPTLAQQMFGAPSQQGAGLIHPWLLSHANWSVRTPPSIGNWNHPGYCELDD